MTSHTEEEMREAREYAESRWGKPPGYRGQGADIGEITRADCVEFSMVDYLAGLAAGRKSLQSLRNEVLAIPEGFDNSQINTILGMIDYYLPAAPEDDEREALRPRSVQDTTREKHSILESETEGKG